MVHDATRCRLARVALSELPQDQGTLASWHRAAGGSAREGGLFFGGDRSGRCRRQIESVSSSVELRGGSAEELRLPVRIPGTSRVTGWAEYESVRTKRRSESEWLVLQQSRGPPCGWYVPLVELTPS